DTRVANPYFFKRLADGVLPERHSACIPKRRQRPPHSKEAITQGGRSQGDTGKQSQQPTDESLCPQTPAL
ncbi:MAG: hypothetical protein KGQ60_00565, partial [Planctomycetes bacterium]|nr:hypothetical protein [Planctomycetota bacterium]